LGTHEIKRILTECRVIAVVGLSREPERASYQVSAYLKKHSYRMIPVNPFADEVVGEKSYRSLLDIPTEIQREIDVVDVFRRAEDVPPIVEQAVKLHGMHGKPCVVWMQLGIVNKEAAEAARKAGLTVVMDKCIMQEHKRLFKKKAKRNRLAKATQSSQ
jgi:predicted CoA-binding protein